MQAAQLASRTVPQQLAHWARIGREFEMSPQVNHRAITQVLAGASSYDALTDQEQAIVREEWKSRIEARRSALDYEADFRVAGESYSEADAEGNVVIHPARP